VTIQAQILDLMRNLRSETGASILLITHDMGVIAEMCDNVAVMYAGQIVEYTDVLSLFDEQLHPYAEGLLAAIPSAWRRAGASGRDPRLGAQPDRTAAGLQICPALSLCQGGVHAA
jgi:ABC-type dipeptide/oligopeptide/nickel transport system ATPase component